MGRNFAKLTCWSPDKEMVLEHQILREGGRLGHCQLTHPEGRVRTHGCVHPSLVGLSQRHLVEQDP